MHLCPQVEPAAASAEDVHARLTPSSDAEGLYSTWFHQRRDDYAWAEVTLDSYFEGAGSRTEAESDPDRSNPSTAADPAAAGVLDSVPATRERCSAGASNPPTEAARASQPEPSSTDGILYRPHNPYHGCEASLNRYFEWDDEEEGPFSPQIGSPSQFASRKLTPLATSTHSRDESFLAAGPLSSQALEAVVGAAHQCAGDCRDPDLVLRAAALTLQRSASLEKLVSHSRHDDGFGLSWYFSGDSFGFSEALRPCFVD